LDFAGCISKPHLIGALQANIFLKGSVNANKLVSLLTDRKGKFRLSKSIWGKIVESGKVHGLVLMMLATGMLELQLKSTRLLGTANISLDNIIVVLGKRRIAAGDDFIDTLAITDDSLWDHFHLRE
jgi:hypothetical protein